jgi:MoaA/NifB/PqqE/SkfB family radical SAM enzyme
MDTHKVAYVLKGLDSFTQDELDNFWRGYDPKVDDPKILGIGLSCSFLCNLKCIYCYAGDKAPDIEEMTLREQLNLVSQAKDLGAKTAIICGDAEPLMDKNLLPIVDHCYRNSITSVIVTNGTIMGDDMIARTIHSMDSKSVTKFLYDRGASLMIKLDSVLPEKYDRIVGVKGSHSKLERALSNVIDAGFCKVSETEKGLMTRSAFSGVIMKNNLEEVPAMKKFANDRNTQFICKLPSLVGRSLDNLDYMFPVEKYEEIRSYLSKFTAKRETLMVDVNRCMAWHYGPVIGIKGDVRECYTSADSIGNIRDMALKELLKIRNRKYDITGKDSCPVKTRINRDFKEIANVRIH